MSEMVDVLSRCGDLPGTLVRLHVADRSGGCAVCSRSTQAGRYTYPCAIRALATRALHLQATRLSGMRLEKGSPDRLI